VGTSTSTSYTDTGLTGYTAYYYKVAAYNSAGEGLLSSYTSATTLFGEAPAGVYAAASSSSSITLSWNTVSGANRYYIERSTSAQGTYTLIAYTSSDISSYSDTGLSSGTTYYYKVRARDSSSKYGDYSLPVFATTP
jgi:hypothetical protein